MVSSDFLPSPSVRPQPFNVSLPVRGHGEPEDAERERRELSIGLSVGRSCYETTPIVRSHGLAPHKLEVFDRFSP